MVKYTNDAVYALVRWSTNASVNLIVKYAGTLAHQMPRFEISGRVRVCHFLAQILHESGELNYTEEIASGADYEGRADLGNTERGDGVRYKGRGLIQLTGRYNYRQAGKAMGFDYEGNPHIVAQLPHSVLVSCWYWQSRGLNALADKGDFDEIVRRINGGYNGYSDRWKYLNRLMTRYDQLVAQSEKYAI